MDEFKNLTPEQVKAGNAKIAELKTKVDQLDAIINSSSDTAAKVLLDGIANVRVRIRHRTRETDSDKQARVQAALDEVNTTHKKCQDKKNAELDAAWYASHGANTVRPKERYRTKFPEEEAAKEKHKAVVANVEAELDAQGDELYRVARESKDPQMRAFVEELQMLEAKTKSDSFNSDLAGKLKMLGYEYKGDLREIADYRSKLAAEHAKAERDMAAVSRKADDDFRADIEEEQLEDWPVDTLRADIVNSTGCYLDPSCKFAVREVMHNIKQAQDRNEIAWKGISNLFVYSKRGEQVVWCKKVKNLKGPGWVWKFNRYYERCPVDKVKAIFDSVGAKACGFIPVAATKHTDSLVSM